MTSLEFIKQYEGVDLDSVEVGILDRLEDKGKKFSEYESSSIEDKNYKWLIASALQKSIRRGLVEEARMYGTALWNLDASYTVRRLVVIALEDIATANIQVCAEACAAVSNVRKLRARGGVSIIAYLASEMAGSVKCRVACDMVCAGNHDMYDDLLNTYHDSSIDTFVKFCEDDDPVAQYVFLSIVSGETKVLNPDTTQYEFEPLDTSRLEEVYSGLEVPTILQYILHKGRKCRAERLHIATLIAYANESADNILNVPHNILAELPGSGMLYNVPEVAYDVHTQVGKKAYSYFIKSAELGTWLSAHKISDKVRFVGSAVFNVEGMLLDKGMTTDFTEKMDKLNYAYNCSRFGVSLESMKEFYTMVTEKQGLLQTARHKVCN